MRSCSSSVAGTSGAATGRSLACESSSSGDARPRYPGTGRSDARREQKLWPLTAMQPPLRLTLSRPMASREQVRNERGERRPTWKHRQRRCTTG